MIKFNKTRISLKISDELQQKNIDKNLQRRCFDKRIEIMFCLKTIQRISNVDDVKDFEWNINEILMSTSRKIKSILIQFNMYNFNSVQTLQSKRIRIDWATILAQDLKTACYCAAASKKSYWFV